jgi:hypothetical protein
MQPDHLGDLIADRVDGVQRRHWLLEDDGDLLRADLAHLLGLERDKVAALPQDLPGDDSAGRHRDELQDRHRGDGLAAAGLADDADGFAAADREIDPVDRVNHAVVSHEMRLQPADVEERRGHSGPAPWCTASSLCPSESITKAA